LLVSDEIILALKSVEQLQGVHEAQLLTSITLVDINQGFLNNFGTLHFPINSLTKFPQVL